MKVSVVIPIYNGEKFLEDTIKSVLYQPYKNIEIICIDDGSTDKSADVVKLLSQADKRVRYIFKENGGVHTARNMGISLSTGEYIVFLDQDDLWVCNSINELFINKILRNKCDFYKCSFYEVSYNLKRCMCYTMPDSDISKIREDKLQHHSSYLFNAEFLKNNNIYTDEYRCEDWRFLMRCYAYANKAESISTPFFMYRNNPLSVSHSGNTVKAIKSSLDGFIWQLYNTDNDYLKNSCGAYSIRNALDLIEQMALLKNAEENIQNILNQYDLKFLLNNYWSPDQDKKDYDEIVNNIKEYIKRCRRKSKSTNLTNVIKKIYFLRHFALYIYSLRKYPEKVEGLI